MDDLAERHVVFAGHDLPGVDLAEVEEIGEQVVDVLCLFADHLADVGRVINGRSAIGEGLRIAGNRRHRRLEVV